MSRSPVLVSGAAGGRQGSTGNYLTRLLLERGVPVRAFVRRVDQRSDDLRARGAEIVEGDLHDLASLTRAMHGVRRAYFTYPVQGGLVEATATFAAAARECGLELVVNLSQHVARLGEQPTPHQRRHWLAEQIFDWAQVGAVHLDPVVFFENLRALARGSIAQANALLLPWGPETTRIPMIAAEDVARVAAGVLTGPTQPSGTVLQLVGAVVTVGDIANAFTTVLGKPIRYREIIDEQWTQAVAGAGINAEALEHLTHLWRHLRTRPAEEQASYGVTSAIETIGGAPPKTLATFLHEQAHVFAVSA